MSSLWAHHRTVPGYCRSKTWSIKRNLDDKHEYAILTRATYYAAGSLLPTFPKQPRKPRLCVEKPIYFTLRVDRRVAVLLIQLAIGNDVFEKIVIKQGRQPIKRGPKVSHHAPVGPSLRGPHQRRCRASCCLVERGLRAHSQGRLRPGHWRGLTDEDSDPRHWRPRRHWARMTSS